MAFALGDRPRPQPSALAHKWTVVIRKSSVLFCVSMCGRIRVPRDLLYVPKYICRTWVSWGAPAEGRWCERTPLLLLPASRTFLSREWEICVCPSLSD